jgi:hypothetical protein
MDMGVPFKRTQKHGFGTGRTSSAAASMLLFDIAKVKSLSNREEHGTYLARGDV